VGIAVLLVPFLVLFPLYLLAADFTGLVVSVLDGDTIEVLHNNRAERIRLHGIDCPEKGQAYGTRAKQAASALVFGKEVTLQIYGKDKYGRTLANVVLPDGTNVNHELVKGGWCWWYRKYTLGNSELERLENEAREAKNGLWKDSAPVPPWVYRKTGRGQILDHSDVALLDADAKSSMATRGSPSLGADEPTSSVTAPASSIIGNRRSKIYHRPDCPSYSQVAPRNRVAFNSVADAESAGYRVAGNRP
jgi:endonuclease YncB( thermonuclease family)